MPFNFLIIIFVQFVIFITFYFSKKRTITSLFKILRLSALFGLLIGLLFDVVLGNLGVYTYISSTPQTVLMPWGLSGVQLLINGLVSFGLAVATAYCIMPKARVFGDEVQKKKIIQMGYLVVLVSLLIMTVSTSDLWTLFACGTFIVTVGELILMRQSRAGLFLSVFLNHNYFFFLQIWFQIIVVGFFCEVVNWIYPFWVWLPRSLYSHFGIEILIVLFGYMVLFHPMIVFWQLKEVE